MTQTSLASTAETKSFFARHSDLTPIFFVYLMIAGFFLFYGTDPSSFRHLLGKKILVPLSNLGLFYYLLLSNTLPSFLDLLKQRHHEIKEGILSFTERDDEISRRWHDTKDKLTHVETETQDILQRAHALAKEEIASLQAKADQKAERIVSETTAQVRQSFRSLQHDMQQRLIDLSFQKAEEILASKLQDSDRTAWQEDFLRQLHV